MVRNQKGVSIYLFVLILFLVTSMLHLVTQATKSDPRKTNVLATLSQIKSNVEILINNDQAWANTLSKNNDMACLNKQVTPVPDCVASGNERSFQLINPSDEVFVDYSNGKGFTLGGEPCDSFSLNDGHATCVLSYKLSWQPLCETGSSCSNPRISVTGELLYAPEKGKRGMVLKTDNYKFVVIK